MEKRNAITSDEQALTAAAGYQQQASALAAAESSLDQSALARLKVLLPDSVDNVGLILDLNALAAKDGISLSSLNVTDESSQDQADTTSTNPVSSVDLSLSGKGTYSSFLNFLNDTEHSERLLDVTSVSVGGADTGVYTYQMTLRLYWLR
jgi:hypothetical protein